jgi:iron complex transport system substrate-binding protein
VNTKSHNTKGTKMNTKGTKTYTKALRRGWSSSIVTFMPFFVIFLSIFVSFVFAFQTPTRIVSLVPAVTEMLFAIGAGPQLVAVSTYDQDPPEVRTLPRVGALLDPDVERILSMKPDLVVTYGSQTDLQQQLQRAAIAAFDYRHGRLADITNTMRRLGAVTGHPREAEERAGRLEREIAAVRTRAAALAKPRTLLVFGRERGALRNIYVSGGSGFLHDMLDAAGGTNVFADVARESVQATTELILARAPEVILEVRSADILTAEEAAREVASWAPLASVPAVRNRRVIVFTGQGLTVPGPRVATVLERMFRALHPTP